MSTTPPTPAYDNTHRALLQSFLSHSTLTLPLVKPILATILSASQSPTRPVLPNDITDSNFNSYIAAINAEISAFDLEIRSALPQYSEKGGRERVWALVNMTEDRMTGMATCHGVDEIAFVKRVVDGMFETYNTEAREVMAITGMQAMKRAKVGVGDERGSGVANANGADGDGDAAGGGTAQSITMIQAEDMLKAMVSEGWFEKQHREYYTLTPRALMELRGWLLEMYNEPPDEGNEGGVEKIKLCHVCKEIVTSGQRCARRECKARLHDQCANGLWRMQRREVCPLCERGWSGTDFVGVRAVVGLGRGGGGGGGGRGTSGYGDTNGTSNENGERRRRRSTTLGLENLDDD